MINLPKPNGSLAIAPSILSADLLNLGEALKLAAKGGADWLHIDIMDGHFVPNLSFGPDVVKYINKLNLLPQDVHLMVEMPGDFIDAFTTSGASGLTLHIESKGDLRSMLEKIQASGLHSGISIKPDTKPEEIKPFLDVIDLVLVMTVYPGFGGQSFLEKGPSQIAAIRDLIQKSGRKIWLEVDGGINKETAKLASKAGADALVAGNAVFGQGDIEKAIKEIRQAALSVL
ncbi:MAG: ribulose-phosphate 3-epimerase [Elusimicrobiota bacterium]|jgi:ribulose-phosphate 3-epimerase|nr:ribulose-phosphate 3-epimerase [Elusimicrobiota bacterium]